jgi:hypothetical protein
MTIPFGLTISLSQMTNRRFKGSFADENGKGIPQEVRCSRIWTNFSVSDDNSPSFPIRLNESFSVSDDNMVKIQKTTLLLSGSAHRRF